MIDINWILLAQGTALLALCIALVHSIHSRKLRPLYRIDAVEFIGTESNIVYYIMQRKMFNKWKVLQIEPHVRGYVSAMEAEHAFIRHMADKGIQLSDTKTIKEYG